MKPSMEAAQSVVREIIASVSQQEQVGGNFKVKFLSFLCVQS